MPTLRLRTSSSSIASETILYIFFFNDTATTEIYTLSLHDALPISRRLRVRAHERDLAGPVADERDDQRCACRGRPAHDRSEEHTSELQSRLHLVCRLLLEKKKIQLMIVLFIFFCISASFYSLLLIY